jgi:nicotinamidase-related amidase
MRDRSKRERGDAGISRRNFFRKSALAGAVSTMGQASVTAGDAGTDIDRKNNASLHVRPRYHRWHVDPGVEWLETNTGYAHLDWKIPLSQTAVVLIDVWQRHYLIDTEIRSEVVIDEKLVPLIGACRKVGMEVIHAPSVPTAHVHPNWVNLIKTPEKRPAESWPPAQFKSLNGPFKAYRRPDEVREPERLALPVRTIHPKVEPLANEAVIGTGDELHEYCKQKGILFLFFAGFNTNACVLRNDYATIKMGERGYQVLVIRDCTTGMETRETQDALSQTTGAILHLEMFGHYSVSSDEMIAGFTRNT